jgi:hypothetical protein
MRHSCTTRTACSSCQSPSALAEAQFKRINVAYDVLSDPVQRQAYDASLGLPPTSVAVPPPSPTTTVQRAPRTSSTYDTSSTSSQTPPPRLERHAQAWVALLANQRRRRWHFWFGTALSSVALLLALVIVLISVATSWLPAPRTLPRLVWMGMSDGT